jgi:D-glycero-alpha-D-manno-heptose-7-phosphate kinase
MIIIRSPLRICLAGGGTDLPSYYEYSGVGKTISLAINKYMHIFINQIPVDYGIIKYSKVENVMSSSEVEHPILNKAFEISKFNCSGYELISSADVPSGTGLGSSGSFAVSTLAALYSEMGMELDRGEIAKKACDIEICHLDTGSGKQDQYTSAYGGLREYTYHSNDSVDVSDCLLNSIEISNWIDHLVLYFTGITRAASDILKSQVKKTNKRDSVVLKSLDETYSQVSLIHEFLIRGDIKNYGLLLNDHWKIKKSRDKNMSNSTVDFIIDRGLQTGAIGAKLIGAGGGGFVMFVVEDKENFIKSMKFKYELEHFSISESSTGVELIFNSATP